MNYVYPIDRSALKARSKDWMRTAQPPFWKAALLYLLITVALPDIINLFLPGQAALTQAENYIMEGEIDQAQYLILQAFQGTSGLILIFVSVLLGLLSLVMNYGYTGYAMQVVRGHAANSSEVFSRFYMAGKIIAAELLMALFVFLWSLLFIIPGLIATYRYQMIPYILLDDPNCSILGAFRRSKQLMRGRKWEFFVLGLSFLPWVIGTSLLISLADLVAFPLYLVVCLACNTFLVPYQQYTFAQWYDAVCAQDAASRNPGPNPYQH